MFQTIGRVVDADAGRRRAMSLGVLVFLAVVAGTVSAGVGMLRVADVVREAMPDAPMVEVIDAEPKLDPPGLPPAAPRPPSPMPVAAIAPVAPPDLTDTTELKDKIDDKVQALAPIGPASPPGPPGGEGRGGACLSGDCAKSGSGTGGGVRTFHASELTVRTQVAPVYPDAARDLDIGDVTCKLRVFIDERGRPYDIDFAACPLPFQDSARDAVLRWRWDPARLDGRPIRAQFVLKIEYRLR